MRLIKVSSNLDSFKTVNFKHGFNIIMAREQILIIKIQKIVITVLGSPC